MMIWLAFWHKGQNAPAKFNSHLLLFLNSCSVKNKQNKRDGPRTLLLTWWWFVGRLGKCDESYRYQVALNFPGGEGGVNVSHERSRTLWRIAPTPHSQGWRSRCLYLRLFLFTRAGASESVYRRQYAHLSRNFPLMFSTSLFFCSNTFTFLADVAGREQNRTFVYLCLCLYI